MKDTYISGCLSILKYKRWEMCRLYCNNIMYILDRYIQAVIGYFKENW